MIELFKIGFLTVTLIDIIDIGLVAVLFFFIYRALRGTVAVQVLIIMVLLIIASFITEAINLRVISWIIKTISSVWLIAYIVLFQPEIRRLLMMATRSNFLRMFVKSRFDATIEEIVSAAKEMSAQHVGALIIFPRSQSVEMTVEKGLELHAIVSKELILSIFNTKSPLHDGAIIIENDLITHAKAILPLSTTTKIEQKILGTRHRAGLGISEQVDAIVMIVSEETGAISIADGGKITFNIDKDKLKDILIDKLSK